MSKECVEQCIFFEQCKDYEDSLVKRIEQRNPILEKLGRYAADDNLLPTVSDFVRVGEELCKSNDPSSSNECMIVSAATVTNALKIARHFKA